MTSNAPLLMEKLLRRAIVSYGRDFLACNELKTEALLVITVDEDTSTRSVISVSDVSDGMIFLDADSSNDNFHSELAHLKRLLDNSLKSTLRESMAFNSIIKLYGIVTYEVNNGIFYVIKLDFEVTRSTETPMARGGNDGGLLDENPEHKIGLERNVTQTPGINRNQANMSINEEYYIELGLNVNNEENIECSICNIQKGDIQLLQVHHAEVHDGHTCLVCAKMLKSKSSLKKHINVAHTPATIECPLCSKKFHTKENLKKHIFTHSKKKTSKPSNCPQEKPNTSNAEGTTAKKDNKSHVSQLQFGVQKIETGIKRKLAKSSQAEPQSKKSNERALEQNVQKKNMKTNIQPTASISMHVAVTPQGPSRNDTAYTSTMNMELDDGEARCGHCGVTFTRRDYLEIHLKKNHRS